MDETIEWTLEKATIEQPSIELIEGVKRFHVAQLNRLMEEIGRNGSLGDDGEWERSIDDLVLVYDSYENDGLTSAEVRIFFRENGSDDEFVALAYQDRRDSGPAEWRGRDKDRMVECHRVRLTWPKGETSDDNV